MPTYALNRNRIKVNSGRDFLIKFGDTPAWNHAGETADGKLSDIVNEIDLTNRAGNEFSALGSNKGTLEMTLMQTSKDEIELADIIKGDIVSLFWNNGIVGGKVQEFYVPEAKVIKKMELEMKGNTPQQIKLVFSLQPVSSGIATCTPDTDLPAIANAEGETPISGVNALFVVLESDPD